MHGNMIERQQRLTGRVTSGVETASTTRYWRTDRRKVRKETKARKKI